MGLVPQNSIFSKTAFKHFFEGWQKKGTDPKKRFKKFIVLVLVGGITGYLTFRRGLHLTPENFKTFVLSLGIFGPVIYVALFIVRPLFLIPSIALFIAGGLAFGPILGPIYASFGAVLGGTVGFWIARLMGHEYVMSRLKFGADAIQSYRFSFSVVFLLSLLPIMPVTVINYGAGLSNMRFKSYLIAHFLGLTPRAFAFGFLGDTLLAPGSRRFFLGLLILSLVGIVSAYGRLGLRREK